MSQPLVYAIAETEKVNERIQEWRKETAKTVKQFVLPKRHRDSQELPQGLAEVYTALAHPDSVYEFNLKEIQRNLISPYLEHNIILKGVANGSMSSVEEAYDELNEVNSGIRRFLPRRENLAHNHRVEELEELIGYSPYLEKKGIFRPDNFVTVGAYSTAGFIAFGSFLCALQGVETSLATLVIGPTSLALGTVFGSLAQKQREKSFIERGKSDAQYLDSKLKELSLL